MYIIVKTIKSSIITHDFIIKIELIYLSAYKLIHVAISLAYSPKVFRFVDFLQQLNGPPLYRKTNSPTKSQNQKPGFLDFAARIELVDMMKPRESSKPAIGNRHRFVFLASFGMGL